ncbi:MAG: ABC transporter ATP-binding protein [bacterium]|jgi:branched-chain amino acid transport system ATP-binding protein
MLNVENLATNYGSIKALKGVSLTVTEGEIVALIGANGAGKTTLMKTLVGLIAPAAGTVRFCGRDITRQQPHIIVQAGISLVPEGRRIFPRMTVLENLELGAYLNKQKKEVASDLENIYRLFPKLQERQRQTAGTLSGGEQQMLAIGRALMSRPKLLLLDEPSMGLAPIIVEEIFEIIKNINKNGTTVLLVEQNAHMALSIAAKGYVLETGTLVLEDRAANLLANDEVRKAYLGQ